MRMFNCIINLDTDKTIKSMTDCLTQEFGICGGMSINDDKLCFSMYESSYEQVMSALHTIARVLTCLRGSYTVSIWEAGNK